MNDKEKQSSEDANCQAALSRNEALPGEDNERTEEVNSAKDEDEMVEEEGSIEHSLARFRDNWRKEIKLIKEKSKTPEGEIESRQIAGKKFDKAKDSEIESHANEPSDLEKEAISLFERGINLEYSGKLYDAVACYRRATQLVPDIESRIYSLESRKNLKHSKSATTPNSNSQGEETFNDGDETDDDEEENLVAKFNSLNIDDDGNIFICQPAAPTSSIHFSKLPYEVVLYILRWVVSDELDLRSAEDFGSVCRGFHILSRDPELWKLACLRIWSITSIDRLLHDCYNDDWRTMFIENPRVNLDGAYISKASYVRQGEASFQDVNYRPCYLIEYYRYFRFLPKGVVLMLNTPEDPYQSLPKLRNQSHPSVIKGHYIIQGTRINCVLKDKSTVIEWTAHGKRGKKSKNIVTEREYRIQMEIRNAKKGRNSQLVWLSYSILWKKSSGEESLTHFDLNITKFPPFWFSRVKSYGTVSVNPL